MKPRVFVSSTFYDLKYLREQVVDFIKNRFFFEPVLFEYDKVPYEPNISLEKSCYNEIKRCQLMILIIGGKYGSLSEENDRKISITQAEYNIAMEIGIPILSFVDVDIYAVYSAYKRLEADEKSNFSNKLVDDIRILDFIEMVENTEPIKKFVTFSDIENCLSEQLSGWFSLYLEKLIIENRNEKKILQCETDILDNKNLDSFLDYIKLKEFLECEIKKGNIKAKYHLGLLYFNGSLQIPRNYELAVKLIREAAEENFPPAQNKLGSIYYCGCGGEQSYEKAFRWQKLAAENGDISGINNTAYNYRMGIGCKRDYVEAREWYMKALTIANEPNGFTYLGLAKVAELEAKFDEAVDWYKKASKKGNRIAFYRLGKLYKSGLLVGGIDERNAIRYFEKSDTPESYFEIGKIYFFQGKFMMAFEWLIKAAQANVSEAFYFLGYMYEYGLNDKENKPDYDKAIEYYSYSAEKGDMESQRNLAKILIFVSQDEIQLKKAFTYMKSAAMQGDSEAQRYLAEMYLSGIGCDVMPGRAQEWEEKAREQGEELLDLCDKVVF